MQYALSQPPASYALGRESIVEEMDPAKKAAFEKQAVIGLTIVFAIVLVMGPFKRVGLLLPRQSPSAVTAAPQKVMLAKPIGELLQDLQDRIDEQTVSRETPRASEPVLPPAYSARELRDPLESLLPEAPANSTPGADHGHTLETDEPGSAPPTPPTLQVQGLVWGGSRPQAIINEKVYSVDDTVEGARILSIDRRGITIDHHGTRVFYALSSALSAEGAMSQQAQQGR